MAEDLSAPGGALRRPAGPVRQPSGADAGWGMTGTMLSGLIVWGGAGWWLDQWLDTRVFVLVGIILGLAASIYLVVVKYGRIDSTPAPSGRRTTPGGRQGHSGTQKGQR